jgi:hypothetical protein
MTEAGINRLIAASSGFRAFDVPDAATFLSRYRSLGESRSLL